MAGFGSLLNLMTKKLYIKTFGCQMNEYDSDKMADVLGQTGPVEATDKPEEADIILFNTCSVREKAQESKASRERGSPRPLARALLRGQEKHPRRAP